MRNMIYHALRWTERITKTDMVYLTKGGFWLGLSHVVLAASALLLAVVFARILPKEIYGNYKYIISLAGMVGALTLSGMGNAIMRSVARGFEGIVRKGISLYARWSIIGVVVTLGAALYYYLNNNTVLALSLAIVSIGVPLLNTSLLFNPFITGRKQFRLNAQYSILTALVPTALLISVASIWSTNVPILVLTYFVGHAGTAFFLLRYTLKTLAPNNKIDPADITYGKHVSVMNVLTSIANHLDKVLLFQLLGGTPVAIYTFATALPMQIRGVFKIINGLIFPKLSESESSRTFKNIIYKSSVLTFAIFILVILYSICAEYLFSYLFPTYMDAVRYSQVFALSLIAGAFGILPAQALHAHRAQKKLYIYHVVAPVFEIIVMALGIVFYGIWGAIGARILSRILNASLSTTLLFFHK